MLRHEKFWSRRIGRNIIDKLVAYGLEEEKSGLEVVTIKLERLLQSIGSPTIGVASFSRISFWYELAKNSQTRKRHAALPSLSQQELSYSIRSLILAIASGYGVKSRRSIVKSIEALSPIPPSTWAPADHYFTHPTINLGGAERENLEVIDNDRGVIAFIELHVLAEDREAIKKSRNLTIAQESESSYSAWNMYVRFPQKRHDPSKVGFFLWTFGEALAGIDGVTTQIQEWSHGSILVYIKMLFRDIFARNETVQLFENLQAGFIETSTLIGESVEVNYHGIPTAEAARLEAEREKLFAESEKIKREVDSLPEADELRELCLEDKKLEIQRKRIENRLLEIEAIKSKIEAIKRMSDLLREGIVQQDEVEIGINDLLFVVNKGGEVKIDHPISEIAEAEEKTKVPDKVNRDSGNKESPTTEKTLSRSPNL